MGSPVLVFAETTGAIHGDLAAPLSKRPPMPPEAWQEFGRRLTEVAQATLAEGVRLVYHHHMGTVVQSAADIHALMAMTGPAVGLLLDTGHATWGGANPAALATHYRERIFHVHAKDVRREVMQRAGAGDWSFLRSVVEGVYTVPGDGMVDYPAVFKALPGYSGWVVIEAEQDPQKANPLEYAEKGFAHLKRYLAAAGLT
jgi:myo-inosose-2 dehydratase